MKQLSQIYSVSSQIALEKEKARCIYIVKGQGDQSKEIVCSSLWYELAMKCACCGGDMHLEKDIGNSLIYKCTECGLSDSRVKKKQDERVDMG